MNDNNLNNSDSNVGTYRATTNLNTAIENPQMNVNSMTDINIKDLDYSSLADNNVNNNLSNGISNINDNYGAVNQYNQGGDSNIEGNSSLSNVNSNDVLNDYNTYQTVTVGDNSNYSYEPVMKEKKRTDDSSLSSLIHSKEFKTMALIIFILVIFVLFMPYIYDFFRQLGMKISA